MRYVDTDLRKNACLQVDTTKVMEDLKRLAAFAVVIFVAYAVYNHVPKTTQT